MLKNEEREKYKENIENISFFCVCAKYVHTSLIFVYIQSIKFSVFFFATFSLQTIIKNSLS
jgi:hypothetical protein